MSAPSTVADTQKPSMSAVRKNKAQKLPSGTVPVHGQASPTRTVVHTPGWKLLVTDRVMEEDHARVMLAHMHTPQDLTEMHAHTFEDKATRAARHIAAVCLLLLSFWFLLFLDL